MASPKHVDVAKQGSDAITIWRRDNIDPFDLSEANLCEANLFEAKLSRADLSRAKLIGANLSGADLSNADLGGATLSAADFSHANLIGANLSAAELGNADLRGAKLRVADLRKANLVEADLTLASLRGANLGGANLRRADVSWADLSTANLTKAHFGGANLRGANLRASELNNAKFWGARCYQTVWSNVDLSHSEGLAEIRHDGPSTIGVDTLSNSKGKTPGRFLRGCGLSSWQVEVARLCNLELSPNDISEILTTDVFMSRTEEMGYPGVFISYSHADSKFVDELYSRLYGQGLSVWRDLHDMVAGEVEKQIIGALRERDVALVVLSEDSLMSQWVWLEIRTALEKEEAEDRTVLCPVALDESWKKYEKKQVVMQQVKEKNILDFSDWESDGFEPQFLKLLKGMRINYKARSAE